MGSYETKGSFSPDVFWVLQSPNATLPVGGKAGQGEDHQQEEETLHEELGSHDRRPCGWLRLWCSSVRAISAALEHPLPPFLNFSLLHAVEILSGP